jgi:hypothetical protein
MAMRKEGGTGVGQKQTQLEREREREREREKKQKLKTHWDRRTSSAWHLWKLQYQTHTYTQSLIP